MRIPRIYQPQNLTAVTHCELSEDGVNHVARVLRMGVGQQLELFDGSNHIYPATIEEVGKKLVKVRLAATVEDNRESNLTIHLGQVISRGDRMEFTVQKSVELGVNVITPLWSERCGVKLDAERMEKKIRILIHSNWAGNFNIGYIGRINQIQSLCGLFYVIHRSKFDFFDL